MSFYPRRAARHAESWLRAKVRLTVAPVTVAYTTLGLFVALAQVIASAQAAPSGGCGGSGPTLGVSRVIEIDTRSGPHFGLQQYKDAEVLAPGEIVLTFDDGPSRAHTQTILNALDAQCTKATFFMVGSQAIADPEMVKRVIARGHTVGSHTWSHANLQKSTPLKARQEIELGLSAVTAAAGQPIAPFFRFPYLAHTKAMLGYAQTRGLGVFSIDVDSQDWKTKNAASVHRDVLSQLAELGKGIILFHDIQPATAQALPGLLEALRVKGYKVVQFKSKATATTLADFDAMARDVNARNHLTAANHPLAKHALTWGSAAPTVLASAPPAAAGARRTNSTAQAGAGGAPTNSVQQTYRPAILGPVQGPFGGPTGQTGSLPPGTTGAPGTLGGDGSPPPRPVRTRPPVESDWRDKIFSH